MTKIGLIQFLLLLLISAAYGQKVKYKDIYALLGTKQFEQAEPFLKQYLRETQDNPNAFLFMGNIFQEKAFKNDILKQTSIALANMDSAILFYDKAHKTLDEREVRKNKEYYEAYNRRDLRTGDFGVKLSDIQFDIEKKIEALKERANKVSMAKRYFSLADSTYQRSNALFLSLQKKYPSENQFYLRAEEETVKDLASLAVRFDSCVKAFEQYKATASALGKTGYNQQLFLEEISVFKVDGITSADFYDDEVRLWNYKKFAEDSRKVIETEILPMRKHLVSYDMEINKLHDKLNKSDESVRNDLTKLIDQLLYDQLKKFDAEPLPMTVFALKTTELAYRSMLLEHQPLRDSANLHLQIKMLQAEMKLLTQLDSTAGKLPDDKLKEKVADYADFVNSTYSNADGLKRYIDDLREFSLREQNDKRVLLDKYTMALNYIIDGADSIPLSSEWNGIYKPLVITPEKFTMGVSLRDTTQLQGYFYTITSSRKAEVKAYFPVDKLAFKASTLSSTRALAYSDVAGQIYYVLVYSEKTLKDKFPATLAKVYRSDGLAWKMDYALGFAPSELIVSTDTGELVIKNGTQQMVVDKNGKVVK